MLVVALTWRVACVVRRPAVGQVCHTSVEVGRVGGLSGRLWLLGCLVIELLILPVFMLNIILILLIHAIVWVAFFFIVFVWPFSCLSLGSPSVFGCFFRLCLLSAPPLTPGFGLELVWVSSYTGSFPFNLCWVFLWFVCSHRSLQSSGLFVHIYQLLSLNILFLSL